MKNDILHRAEIAKAALKMGRVSQNVQALLDYIDQLERDDSNEADELRRLREIEERAILACNYHDCGRNPDFTFDADHMLSLMADLEMAL